MVTPAFSDCVNKLGVDENDVIPFGRNKAKISLDSWQVCWPRAMLRHSRRARLPPFRNRCRNQTPSSPRQSLTTRKWTPSSWPCAMKSPS